MMYRILVINPGSTSTKIAVYENETPLFFHSISHDAQILNSFKTLDEQTEYRKHLIVEKVREAGLDLHAMDIVMCRGGLVLYPQLTTGGYEVNADLYEALGRNDITHRHASQFGGLIGKQLADELGIKAYIYDAVTAGDLSEVARVTGCAEITRRSFCHVLNSRATAIKYAGETGKVFDELRLIVAHLGGGCSIAVYKGGKIIESAGDDEGPFSPERAGAMPLLQFIDICYSGKYTKDELQRLVRGKGGMYNHLGTSDCREIERRIAAGDSKAALIFQSQAYQISKGIALNSAILKGQVDAVILTGGMAHSIMLTELVKDYVSYIGPVVIMAGENEMEALVLGGLRILQGAEMVREYTWPEGFEHAPRSKECIS